MPARKKTHTLNSLAVEGPTGDIAAATDITLTARVSCPYACDLRGHRVRITDGDVVIRDDIELNERHGDTYATGAVTVTAPVAPGTHTWAVAVVAHEGRTVDHEGATAVFTLDVTPHVTSMALWGAPPAIPGGSDFVVTLGITCACGCALAGRPFAIFDHEGRQVADGRVAEPLPGTAKLYGTRVDLRAPDVVGVHRWRAVFESWSDDVPHTGATYTFSVTTVAAPDSVVTIEAADRDSGTRLPKVPVVMHPFRTVTDAHGVARLAVPRGTYDLFVSGPRHIPYRTRLDVDGDLSLAADLVVERQDDPYDYYVKDT
jgi:hypothetical protein